MLAPPARRTPSDEPPPPQNRSSTKGWRPDSILCRMRTYWDCHLKQWAASSAWLVKLEGSASDRPFEQLGMSAGRQTAGRGLPRSHPPGHRSMILRNTCWRNVAAAISCKRLAGRRRGFLLGALRCHGAVCCHHSALSSPASCLTSPPPSTEVCFVEACLPRGEGGRPPWPTPRSWSGKLGGWAAGREGATQRSNTSHLSHRAEPLFASTDVPRAGGELSTPTPLPPIC